MLPVVNAQGIEFTLCVSQLSSSPSHKHTGGYTCVSSIHTPPLKKTALTNTHKLFTFSSITHSSSLALTAALLRNVQAAVAMQAGTHTEQCTEQCVCVCLATLWCMHRDGGEAINEYSVLATSCFPVNIAVSVHECVCVRERETILPNCFSSQETAGCHSFYHPPPLLRSIYLKS